MLNNSRWIDNNITRVKKMVILFSKRKSRTEKEIIEILTSLGGDYISDRTIQSNKGVFTVVSEYKPTDLKLKNGIAVILENSKRFDTQAFDNGIIGICEDINLKAFEQFKKSKIPVISCGMNPKSTITLSSINSDTVLVSLQRIITDINNNDIEPFEFKIKLKKNYNPFSITACAIILLLYGIIPEEF